MAVATLVSDGVVLGIALEPPHVRRGRPQDAMDSSGESILGDELRQAELPTAGRGGDDRWREKALKTATARIRRQEFFVTLSTLLAFASLHPQTLVEEGSSRFQHVKG